MRLVKKVEDLCFFISEAEKESVYLMTPCNFELKNNEEYIYDGENSFNPNSYWPFETNYFSLSS